MKDSLLN